MAIIQRNDGIQFIVRCYRETLSLSNTTLFKQHAFLISEMHGYFAKFLPGLGGGKKIESVFSTDPGFLFAEMAWHHFNKPTNMIFCEQLHEGHFLTVIVRDGLIFTDGDLNAQELLEELAAASVTMNHPAIYIYGDIPGLTPPKNPDIDAPYITAFNQKSITVLKEPLFEKIEPSPVFELVPIQQAISDLQLSKASQRNLIGLISLFAIVIVAAIAFYVFSKPEPIQTVDPLANFRAALTSPSPQAFLGEVAQEVLLLNSIPGWGISQVSITGTSVSAIANSYGGSAQFLLAWAKANRATLAFSNTGVNITSSLPSIPNRPVPSAPTPIQTLVAKLIDTSILLSTKKTLSLDAATPRGSYTAQSFTIQLSQASPMDLQLYGVYLNNLPITISGVQLSFSSGTISGTISATLYGA
ncbi:MAG: hypothetical protein K0S08_796 [Gammaproteobacteria bacterium]|jgi:hypothetical protein|nr:hypothetical protein [Gammaproteobacteria bacterium]